MILLLAGAFLCAAVAARLALAGAGGRRTRGGLARAASYGRVVVEAAPVEQERRRGLPGVDALARVIAATPGRDRARTLVQLQAAGFTSLRPESFLALKGAAALAGLVLGAALGVAASAGAALLLALLLGAIGFVGPDLVLRRRATRRREAILAELPNALDLLAVIVEAGLGFDAALVRYADTTQGALSREIALLATELRVGGARDEAFRRLTERVDAPELKTFVRSVLHADHLGTSLSRTLRSQASDVRYRRQSAAEERANKMPVKMLFPTVFCIFPALFVVVLGPPLLSLLGSFK